MHKTYFGVAVYKVFNTKNGLQRIACAFSTNKITQRNAAYVSGDFLASNINTELARAQHILAVKQLVAAEE